MHRMWMGRTSRLRFWFAAVLFILAAKVLQLALHFTLIASLAYVIIFICPLLLKIEALPALAALAAFTVIVRRRLRDLNLPGIYAVPYLMAIFDSFSCLFIPFGDSHLILHSNSFWIVVVCSAILGFAPGKLAAAVREGTAVNLLQRLSQSEGRMSRLSFARRAIPAAIIFIALQLVYRYFPFVPGTFIRYNVSVICHWGFWLLLFLTIPIFMRRMHDLGMPSLFVVICPIGFSPALTYASQMLGLLNIPGLHSINYVAVVSDVLEMVVLIILLSVKGEESSNSHGPPPSSRPRAATEFHEAGLGKSVEAAG